MTQEKDTNIDWNTSFNKRIYILQYQIKVFQKEKVT